MSNFRLSQDIIPSHYEVSFEPDIPAKIFSARQLITFISPSNAQTDHAELFAHKSLTIHSITQNGAELKYSRDEETSRFNIFGDNLTSHPVEINFYGSLDHFTMGWYYVNDECCSSQFESSYARYLMPCFDEPCVKCTFSISITTLKHLTAYSNMPAQSILTNEDNTKRTFTFHQTPPMSCYLLALVVGDFDMKTGFTKRHLPVDVIAPRGKAELMDEPLQIGIRSVEWLEDFLQVDFPLPRLQLITVPEFQYGAMENFGLLIFRASCFLFKTGVTSLRSLYYSANTISHEIVHQWAGDCTSPKWWNSIWLNEGFASIMPYIMLDEMFPDWKIFINYHLWQTIPAFSADSSPSTHPICCEANSPEEIEALFDQISYSKACSIISMLKNYISLEKLRDALRIFYKRFYYKCAETDDLIECLREVITDQKYGDIGQFVKFWTSEKGYPLVTFDGENVSQARFTTNGLEELPEDKAWPIPLFILRKKKNDHSIVMDQIMFDKKTMSIKAIVDDSEWVKLNPGYRSFCRVYYSGEAMHKLLPIIKDKTLDGIDRWSILYDSISIARAGLMPYGNIIELFEAYSEEDEYLSAIQITGFMGQLMTLFPSLSLELQEFGKLVLGGILYRIGDKKVDGEPPDRSQLRCSLLSNLTFLCNDEKTRQIGLEYFRYFHDNRKCPEGFDSNLLPFMMKCGAHYEKGATEFLWDVVKNEKDPEIQCQACVAVGFCPIDELPENMVKSLSANKQDVINFFAGFSCNPEIGDRFYNFVKENCNQIYSMFESLAFNLPRTFEYAAGDFADEAKANDLEEFFKNHPAKVAEPTVSKLVDQIRSKAKLAASQYDSVKTALQHIK